MKKLFVILFILGISNLVYGADVVLGTIGNNFSLYKTSSTNVDTTGDDQNLQAGQAYPSPRFIIQSDTNVVLDSSTGLMWTREASPSGARQWTNSITECNDYTTTNYSDWRCPNVKEYLSLFDWGTDGVTNVPAGHPFVDIKVGTTYYWTSTTDPTAPSAAFRILFGKLTITSGEKDVTAAGYYWPCRGP